MMLKSLHRCTGALAALAAACLFAAGPVAAQEEKVLNIYNWSDYIAEDTLANFEKETGIKVRYDNFDNNEIVHAKLVAGKTGYDVVVPSSYWAKLQADGGLLRKLDKSKLPGMKNLDPALQEQLAVLDPGNEYMVDWLWGFTTVGINVDKVKAAVKLTTDRAHALRQAIYCCRKAGTLSVPGVYVGFPDKIPMGALMNKGLTLKTGQTHMHRYMKPLLKKIEAGEIDPSFVITHRVPLEQAPEAYKTFRAKDDGCIKVVLNP